jgi:tetratricopeptide (TPR) repeat protein
MNGTSHGASTSASSSRYKDDYPFDMGAHHRPITTSSPAAQVWFDRGLAWALGFQHEEAVKCYKLAIEADKDCAMAYWGVAYSTGPHYNFGWESLAPALLPGVVKMTHDCASKANLHFRARQSLQSSSPHHQRQ